MIETKHIMNTIHTSMCNDAKPSSHLDVRLQYPSDKCKYNFLIIVWTEMHAIVKRTKLFHIGG